MSIIGLLVVFVVCFCALWYWAGSIRSDLKEVVALSVGGSEAALQEKLQAMRKELRETVSEREKLREFVIAEEDVPQFLNDIEGLGGSGTRIFVRSIDVDKDAAMLRTSFAFSGSFAEVQALVKEITEIRYVLYVDSFEMRTGRSVEGRRVWDATMSAFLPMVVEDEE